ncbi:MAG: hypothetical protein Ta2F_15970 [Termitinemataceae bacterium]|nr:MAG: hypothetical protein Ta2F_15970 [Termitinemataceae bacterium]
MYIIKTFLIFAIITVSTLPCQAKALTLDKAIKSVADYFIKVLPENKKIAVRDIEAVDHSVASYIVGNFMNRFEESGKFIILDRQNLAVTQAEFDYQYGSGRVDDAKQKSMTRQEAPDIIITGSLKAVGKNYQLVISSIDLVSNETRQQSRTTQKPGNLMTSGLSLDASVYQVLSDLGKRVVQKTVVAIGEISNTQTGSTTSLSRWLKNSIETSIAQRNDGKFSVVSFGSGEDALIKANFNQAGNDVEVTLQLVDTKTSAISSSGKFKVSAKELSERNLSVLPQDGDAAISSDVYWEKQKAIEPYKGDNNKIKLVVTPNHNDRLYKEGDIMSFQVSADKECYIKVTYLDVYGKTRVIFPRNAQSKNKIEKGGTITIPDTGRFRMTKPYGEEIILIAAYEKPFGTSTANVENVTAASVKNGLKAKGIADDDFGEYSDEGNMNPVATTMFRYSIDR